MITAVTAAFIVSLPVNWFAITKCLMLRRDALTWNFSPVFAIALPRWLVLVGNVGAPVGISTALLFVDYSSLVRNVIVIGLLIVWLLCKNLRVSNHSFLAVVTIIALSLSGSRESAAGALGAILAAMYLAAGIAKMNRAYLLGENSLGRRLVDLNLSKNARFLARTPDWARRGLHVGATFVVPALELLVGLMMLANAPLFVCLLIGLSLHFFFGIAGNSEFTSVAAAIWMAMVVLSEPVSIDDIRAALESNRQWVFIYLLSVILATAVWQCTWHYRSRLAGMVNEIIAAVFFGVMSSAAVAVVQPESVVVVTILPFIVTLAGTLGAVLVGARLEFSFAMLSNLRPYGREWILFIPKPRVQPRYYFLRLPSKIPVSLFNAVPVQFIRSATSREFVVHISTATSLARLFSRHGVTLLACRAVPDPQLGRMVPVSGADPSAWIDLSTARPKCLLFPPLIPADLSHPIIG